MPFDLEAEIARRLRVAPETVGPVLHSVIERIRKQVSHFGYARVAGLGTFRGHNGHLAFEPEPVLADEVNARFGGLEILDVAPARHAHEDEDVEPFETPEEDETLYGPSPGDDYERGDAGMDDEDEREDTESEDAERSENFADGDADAHATIKPVYDPAGVPGAEYDLESSSADAGEIDGWPEGVDETAYREEGELLPGEQEEETARADDSSEAIRWGDQTAGIEPEAEEPAEEDADRFGSEQAKPSDADDVAAYWTGEEEEHADETSASAGWAEPAADVEDVDWRDGDEVGASEEDEWPREDGSHEAERIPAAGWLDDTVEPDIDGGRFPENYAPAEPDIVAAGPEKAEPGDTGTAHAEPASAEPAGDEPAEYDQTENEAAEYEWADGELAEDHPPEAEAPDDAPNERPSVAWNPPDERSEADLYAEEEAAMAAGAIGGAAADARDEEAYVDDDALTGSGEIREDEPAGDYEYAEPDDEAEAAFGDAPEQDSSVKAAADRDAMPHEGAQEPAGRRSSPGSADTGAPSAGRRSAVLISIGVVVLLAAAAFIYLATSSSPVEEATEPRVAETPTAQDTTTVAASEGPGAAASDTADVAVTTPPADPTSDRPVAETPLDPLRGTEPIDRTAGGYTLVVFSDFSNSNANRVAATYGDQGFRTGVLDDQDGGRTRFRVGVGQFSTLEEAVAARDRLAGDGLPDDAWVRRIQ